MKRIIRNTIVAGAGALSLLAAAPARADHDEAREHRAATAAPVRFERDRRAEPVRWNRGYRDTLARERREIEEARARFYGQWNGNPWERRRFESWYASRCAELDRRADASFGHGRWRG